MIARAEASQLDLFAVLNLFGVAVAPFKRYFRVGVGVDQHIEGAVAVQHGQKGYRCRDLSEDGLDFRLYLRLGLFFWRVIAPVPRVSIGRRRNVLVAILWCGVLVLGCLLRRLGLCVLAEYLYLFAD
jgi:hypothetical protein